MIDFKSYLKWESISFKIAKNQKFEDIKKNIN